MVATISANIFFRLFCHVRLLTNADVTSVCYKTHKPQVHISIKHWDYKNIISRFSIFCGVEN